MAQWIANRKFQFHKGTIKTLRSAMTTFKRPTFQFHKGTIKTNKRLAEVYLKILIFQFHKGTIKTMQQPLKKFMLRYFNSIKVRLKLLGSKKKLSSRKFQFHKGTIKTQAREVVCRVLFNFNSIKVRLKHHVSSCICVT